MVKVADGDTITVLDAGNNQHKIRLNAIDAPEKSQAFGQKSREHLSNLIGGKNVTVIYKSKDRYGRILGTVLAGSLNVNLQMLRDGFAWHYKRYDKTREFSAAEAEARKERRGLWIDQNPIQPEKFRHSKASSRRSSGERETASQTAAYREEYFAGRALPVSSRTAAPVCDKWPDTGYWLNTNSNKRHNRDCDNYRKTRGYPCKENDGTPCGKCGG